MNQYPVEKIITLQREWRLQTPHNFDVHGRRRRLEKLLHMLDASTNELCAALHADLGRPPAESVLSEIIAVKAELTFTLKKLKKWARERYVAPTLTTLFARSGVRFDPKGNVLILSPWNYPVVLTLRPLISAIAAGNSVVIKPSEHSPATAALLAKLIAQTFDTYEVCCFVGGADIAQDLVKQPFDHIFFTGSSQVGKKIAEAAAQNLTTLSLELGGKCPVLLHDDVNIIDAAEKISWGRFLNAGQTCLAPDYVLVPRLRCNAFIAGLQQAILKRFYNASSYDENYGRIINHTHHDRLTELLNKAKAFGDEVVLAGDIDREKKLIGPTIVICRSMDSPLMKEELFGPILVVIAYESVSDAVAMIRAQPAPLCIYGFSHDSHVAKDSLATLPAGATVINDVLTHYAHSGLPFGGVGASGFGRCNGRYGFEAFSNYRAIFQAMRFNPIKYMYAPYTEKKRQLIDFMHRFL